MELIIANFKLFFLVFARITSLFFMAPFYGSTFIPIRIKAGFALAASVVVFPVLVNTMNVPNIENVVGFFIAVINQIAVGFIIGLVAQLFFSVFLLSGQYYTIQMGFGMIRTVNPLSGVQSSILGILQSIIALMIFLGIDGHHYLFYVIVKSFHYIPYFKLAHLAITYKIILKTLAVIFKLGFVFALPIISTMFITTMSMGLLSKVAPQMNVMMFGFPVKIAVGLLTLIWLQPYLYTVTVKIIYQMINYMNEYLLSSGTI